MASSPDKLTPLQRDLLQAFFEREQGFFLTGGAALAGFYLKHRETTDLDLFTESAEALERGFHALAAAADSLGAIVMRRQLSPGFERYVVTRGDQSVVVDLVWDRAPQMISEKRRVGVVRIDPIEEILANKLTTALSRGEERDLVDLFLLERAGQKIESALPAAMTKDGGCTPAALAWVLSEIRIPDQVSLPGSVSPAELRAFLADVVRRLRRAALP
jgi:predicted nucleotidyltransferase component of viral defense system